MIVQHPENQERFAVAREHVEKTSKVARTDEEFEERLNARLRSFGVRGPGISQASLILRMAKTIKSLDRLRGIAGGVSRRDVRNLGIPKNKELAALKGHAFDQTIRNIHANVIGWMLQKVEAGEIQFTDNLTVRRTPS
ncbi:hypothetical protein HY994_03995 [Candidatus Micrarchaeota archaeon]|nr:hypothetical protein [Candidatus Micrarchaeota archaeon]